MSGRTRLWSTLFTVAVLVAATSSTAYAQAQIEQESPGPEGIGQPGCSFPHDLRIDPFTGRQVDAIIFPGSPSFAGTSSAGPEIRGVAALHIDASKKDLTGIRKDPDVASVGKAKDWKPGGYTVVIVDHNKLPKDVGLNVFTNLDGKPYNDVPAGMDDPTNPIAGNDGGWTVFASDGRAPRLLSTFFGDGRNAWYAADFAAAAMATPEQTALLIADRNHGDTVTPFFFDGGAYHVAGWLPNGVLPVNGQVPLTPSCASQEIIHKSLIVDGIQVSASTDSIAICLRLSPSELAVAEGALLDVLGESIDLPIEVTFDGYDPESKVARKQSYLASLRLEEGRLYVVFPAGLLRFGYTVVTNISFAPGGAPDFDALLGAAARGLNEWLVPINVTAAEGLIQGGQACQPPWGPPPPVGA